MRDIYKPKIRGEFSLTSIKNGKVIDTYSDHNLIMDGSQLGLARILGGGGIDGHGITSIKLGTRGHRGDDLNVHKEEGDTDDGFLPTLTTLFSEDPDKDADDETNKSYTYEIKFNTTSEETSISDESALGNVVRDADADATTAIDVLCKIDRSYNDNITNYSIELLEGAGQNEEAGSTITYTEAALFIGDKIFSMKTFPVRVKDDQVKFVISWKIIFD